MSALWSVRARPAGPQVTLEVTPIHPDAGRPPVEASFAIHLLLDVWSMLADGWRSRSLLRAPVMEAEIASALAASEPWGSVFAHLRGLRDGVELPLTKEAYRSLTSQWQGKAVVSKRASRQQKPRDSIDRAAIAALRRRQKELLDSGGETLEELVAIRSKMDDVQYDESFWVRVRDAGHEAEFRRRAEQLVASVSSQEAGTAVAITATLRDGALLGFLPDDVAFETASYV